MLKIIYFSIQSYFRLLSFLAPKLAGKQAFELFQKPHMKKTRTRELALFDHFKESRIPAEGEDLFVYSHGDQNDYPVILVHGWDSNPGSLYGIAQELAKHPFHVIVLSLPAHGKSKLTKTNMIHSSEMIKVLLDHYGLKNNFSMVTHSFGSGTSTIALRETGIKADLLLFLTTPDRMWDIFDNYRAMIKLGKKAYSYLLKEVEKLSPIKIDEFNISDLVQEVKYKKLILVHDKNDKILPWENALRMKEKNPKIELIETKGKGHYRLLWDPYTIELAKIELLKFIFKQ